MNSIQIGSKVMIHSYKHNGLIYRSWDESIVLDIKDDYIVLGNNRTLVTEVDGRTWKTREPAIIYFYKKRWFNVICQLKSRGIYYYCNIATPFVIEEQTIKYIDYDLDLRIFPDESYKILDKEEYQYHKKEMDYSNEIDLVVKNELNSLIKMHNSKEDLFNLENVEHYRFLYEEMNKQK